MMGGMILRPRQYSFPRYKFSLVSVEGIRESYQRVLPGNFGLGTHGIEDRHRPSTEQNHFADEGRLQFPDIRLDDCYVFGTWWKNLVSYFRAPQEWRPCSSYASDCGRTIPPNS